CIWVPTPEAAGCDSICFLCAHSSLITERQPGVAKHSTVRYFFGLKTAKHTHAAWLASETTTVLASWDEESDGLVGKLTGAYVPAILARRLAHEVIPRWREHVHETGASEVFSSSGGTRIVLSLMNHPMGPDDESVKVGVDLRIEPGRWKFRPYVEAAQTDQRDETQARVIAHKLAWEINEFLGVDFIRETLASADHLKVAQALTTSARYPGGYKKEPANSILKSGNSKHQTAQGW